MSLTIEDEWKELILELSPWKEELCGVRVHCPLHQLDVARHDGALLRIDCVKDHNITCTMYVSNIETVRKPAKSLYDMILYGSFFLSKTLENEVKCF